MGYANPVEAMGMEKFVQRAKEAGVDGVLTVDYPPEECKEFVALLQSQEIDPIFLLSPTTEPARVDIIVNQASGFVYYVSLKGVTGAKNLDIVEVAARVKDIRAKTDIPIGVGFGVRDAATAKAVAEIADAVVVGSRMVQAIEQSTEANVATNVAALMTELRSAIDSN
jgi:tryptophan synthase alpha chain